MTSALDAIFSSTTSTGSTGSKKDDKSILGKEDFLSLLVAQMKNQDPLNPDDPTQFTAQLAQFSQLEQLFNLNGSMDNLVSSYENATKLTALGTIGKEVAFESDTLTYDGTPVTFGYQLDDDAAEVSVTLKKDGVVVAVLQGEELGKGTHYLNWDGLNSKGEAAAADDYTIVVQATDAQGETVQAAPVIRAIVTGADLDGTNGGTLLTNSGNVSFNSVLGVFDVESQTKNKITDENV